MANRFSAYLHKSHRVFPGAWTREGDWLVARWRLRYGHKLRYKLETSVLIDEPVPAEPPSTASALAAIVLPAMRDGRAVRLPGPVDAATWASLERRQDMCVSFFPDFHLTNVPVRPPGRGTGQPPRQREGRVGVFMSLGVDSCFSLLSHQEEIDDLILVRGFEMSMEPYRDALWAEMVEAGRSLAAAFGKRLILVRTNLRPFLEDRSVPWGISHGAALAHVALLLEPWLRAVYVPSSFDINNITPWGSHPDLDPLWSTEGLEIRHDGLERCRLEKIQRLAESPVVLRHLRVCNRSPTGLYNCGRCAKCLPTMLALDTVGALERCATFPDEVTELDVRAVYTWGLGGRLFMAELRDWWQEHDPEHDLLPLVETILAAEDLPR